MREHPEKIEQINLKIIQINERLQNVRDQIGKQEALMTLEIVTAKDELGKPLYPKNLCEMPRFFYQKTNPPNCKI
jgi:hypothetical protein